jgi:hypothetical protein
VLRAPGKPRDNDNGARWWQLALLLGGSVLLLLVSGLVLVRRRGPRRARDPIPPQTAASAPPDVPGNGAGAPVVQRLSTHLLFVATYTGYVFVEGRGDPPPVGLEVDGDDLGLNGRFSVVRIGSSPLPQDPRRCAYLQKI